MSSEVFVVEGKRTPFGSLGGVLVDVDATALGTTVIKGLLEAALLAPETINEVIIGQVLFRRLRPGSGPAGDAWCRNPG